MSPPSPPSFDEALLVLAALRPQDREALLAGVPRPMADRLRAALGRQESSPQIDHDRQRAALARFLRHSSNTPTPSPQRATSRSRAPSPALPFARLRDATPDELAGLLADEPPQVIAVVLAHLEPAAAARIVRELAPNEQADVLARLATLDALAPATLASLEEAIEMKIRRPWLRRAGRTSGLRAVQAILDHVAPGDRPALLTRLRNRQVAVGPPEASAPPVPPSPVPTHGPPAPVSRHPDHPAPSVPPPIRLEFGELEGLASHEWNLLLQVVPPDVAAAALAGAPPALAERVMRAVTPPERDRLRRQIRSLGPIAIRDIQAAQEALCDHACQLMQTGKIRPLPHRPFAAAV